MNIFKEVKNKVSPIEAAGHYGIKVTRNGMCRCPFHNDRNPSMKLDAKTGGGFYCFGCQEKGDVIDLIARLTGLSKYEAALQLAQAFNITYDQNGNRQYTEISESEKELRNRNRQKADFSLKKKALADKILSLMSEMREEKYLSEEKALKILEADELYQWIINRLDKIEDTLEFLISQPDTEVSEVIDKIEKEVTDNVYEFEKIRRGYKTVS